MPPNLPEKYIGDPIRFRGITKNPYEDLDKVSGLDHENEDMSEIGQQTRELQEKLLGITVLTPPPRILQTRIPEIKEAQQKMRERLKKGTYYFMDEDGAHVYLASLLAQNLQAIGAFTPEIHNELLRKRSALLELNDHQNKVATELIDCPTNSLIIETGAGADYKRLSQLYDYAQRRKSHLICHDIPPAASRAFKNKNEDVPYLALPNQAEFLSVPFQGNLQPKFITSKDIISSMSFGSLEQLVEFGRVIDAEKMIITQSLAISPNCNMFAENFRPYDRQFVTEALNLDKQLFGYFPKHNPQPYIHLALDQIGSTVLNIFMEKEQQKIIQDSKNFAKMSYHNTCLTHFNRNIEGDQAIQYLATYFPEYLDPYLRNEFNLLYLSPFGIRFFKVAHIPKGTLNVTNSQFNLVLSKKPFAKKLISEEEHQSVTNIAENDILTPTLLQEIRPAESLARYNNQNIGTKVKNINTASSQFSALIKAAQKVGIRMVFEVYANKLGLFHHASLPEKNKKMIRDGFA